MLAALPVVRRDAVRCRPKKARIAAPEGRHEEASYGSLPPGFETNLTSLCTKFPNLHQGLIASFLRSSGNNLNDASRLIEQVWECQLASAQFIAQKPLHDARGKHKRSVRPYDTECHHQMSDEDDVCQMLPTVANGNRPRQRQQQQHQEHEEEITSCSPQPRSDGALRDVGGAGVVQHSASVGSSSSSSSSTSHSNTEAPAACDGTSPLSNTHVGTDSENGQCIRGGSAASSGFSPAKSNQVKSSDKALEEKMALQLRAMKTLSRVVLRQSERIALLNHESRRIIEENTRLKQQVEGLKADNCSANELNRVLVTKLSSLGALPGCHPEERGMPDYGPDAGGFNPLRRLPDVF